MDWRINDLKISGFTFVHNALHGGYPIVEAVRAVQPYVDEVVIVDCQSTDNTWSLLEILSRTCAETGEKRDGFCSCGNIRIVGSFWGTEAGETLRQAHSQYEKCFGDVIIHFEADEVYDDTLISEIVERIENGDDNLSVYRLQLEQNFQRCRWYPELVHRVFPKRISNIKKEGHTTNQHNQATLISPEHGYLWDVTNCFRDNWMNRVEQQAELRQSSPHYLLAPLHILHEPEIDNKDYVKYRLNEPHWTWTTTPFDIPDILKPLVGVVKYEPRL